MPREASTHMPQLAPLPSFGKRLKRQRVAVGLKQDALATVLGLNQATISRWERGYQVPDAALQHRAFEQLALLRADDAALKRLVENNPDPMHLVDEAGHTCLAYSAARAEDWNTSTKQMLGVSLWQFATDEIRQAEAQLESEGWWDALMPTPKTVVTSGAVYPQLKMTAGGMMWERLYLADGTPVRLVTKVSLDA